MPTKKSKLQSILKAITPDETQADFKVFDEQVQNLKDQLKQKIEVKTLDDVNNQIDKFRRRIDLQPLLDTIGRIEQGFNSRSDELVNQLNQKSQELQELINGGDQTSNESIDLVKQEIGALETQIAINEATRQSDVSSLKKDIETIQQMDEKINKTIKDLTNNLTTTTDSISKSKSELRKEIKDVSDTLEKLRKEFVQRLANLGGGQAAPRVQINGTTMSTRFADINWKAGAGTTITYADNQTTKQVDITITGSAGSGIVRSINSISTPTTAAATSGTDYVYLVSGTTTLTLPDATTNQNLYTVKNVGTGVVTIATTSAQTIDGTTTITLPVQYTSVDLISDSANWGVT